MCLFLQNQRFQELTARMVSDMAAGSRAANATLAAISGQLEDQQERLEGAQTQLGRLQVRRWLSGVCECCRKVRARAQGCFCLQARQYSLLLCHFTASPPLS
jgi:hypothetical protein